MQPAELDRLPFGTIQLDRDGRVKSYNRYEQDWPGSPGKESWASSSSPK
jgi:hypothetical protein